jgi:hypothetical protein
MEVMVAHARDPVVPPSRLRAGVPADLEKIVLRCLEKNPEARFQSAHGLATALDGCADARGWSPQKAALWWQSQEPAASIHDPLAGESSGITTGPMIGSSTLNSDSGPTLEASSIELNAADSSAEGPGLSLTVAEDRARPERRR